MVFFGDIIFAKVSEIPDLNLIRALDAGGIPDARLGSVHGETLVSTASKYGYYRVLIRICQEEEVSRCFTRGVVNKARWHVNAAFRNAIERMLDLNQFLLELRDESPEDSERLLKEEVGKRRERLSSMADDEGVSKELRQLAEKALVNLDEKQWKEEKGKDGEDRDETNAPAAEKQERRMRADHDEFVSRADRRGRTPSNSFIRAKKIRRNDSSLPDKPTRYVKISVMPPGIRRQRRFRRSGGR